MSQQTSSQLYIPFTRRSLITVPCWSTSLPVYRFSGEQVVSAAQLGVAEAALTAPIGG